MQQLFVFVSGLVIGALIFWRIGSKDRPMDNSAPLQMDDIQSETSFTDSPGAAPTSTRLPREVDSHPPAINHTVSPQVDRNPPIRLPPKYRALIGPVTPRPVTFSEEHARFANEPRDEAWASSMESGLSAYIASYGAGQGTVIEYIECRARHCELAGFVSGDGQLDMAGVLRGVRSEGWWQGGNKLSQINAFKDGQDRFVVLINRQGF